MLRRVLRLYAVSTAVLLLLAGGAVLGWLLWLPDVRPLRTRPPRTTAYMELRRRQAAAAGRKASLRWTWTPYAGISEALKEAVVAAEDDGFWRHDGIDRAALRAAAEEALREGRFRAGGSTITMQLARNLYLSPSKNPLRKLKEILIARRLEKELGKRRILELYLNVAEWGRGVFGCEEAARAYFGKACAELDREEAAAMAVVLPNPRRWSPDKRGPYVERNSRRVMGRLIAAGLWAAETAEAEEAVGHSTSTIVISSSGSDEIDQGRNPITEE